MTVTEDGSETDFSGGAAFGIGSEASSSDNEAVVIHMLDGEKMLEDNDDVGGTWTEMIIRNREIIEIPSEGDWDITRWDMNSRDLSSCYGTTRGTVHTTNSSETELQGNFSFSAYGASVEASFTAEKTDNANRVTRAPDCEDADDS